MEKFNSSLFILLNAQHRPDSFMFDLAYFFAEYAVWAGPLALLGTWLLRDRAARRAAVGAGLTAVLGLLLNQLIALFVHSDRPFVLGVGHTFLTHASDASFPSDHATFIWCVATGFLLAPVTRLQGMLLALLGIPIGWARIYLGVHFPVDILGGAVVAAMSGWLVAQAGGAFVIRRLSGALERLHDALPEAVRR